MNAFMNAQDRDEEFGDGYSNEFQRAHAVSSMNRPPSEIGRAKELAAKGLFVVCYEYTQYCKLTDGILGSSVALSAAFKHLDAAQAHANKLAEESHGEDSPFIVYPPGQEPQAPAPAPATPEDDVPF